MPIGVNAGNQLNVFVFEVVMVAPSVSSDLPPVVTPIAVHPLLVAPTTIQYTRSTRSTANRNMDGALHVKAGRNLDTIAFQGTFGSEFRGIGLYGGDGELRRRFFEKQVVALGDAINRTDIEEALGLFGTDVGASLAQQLPISTTASGDPTNSGYFAINLYDFYNRRFFQCQIVTYATTRAFRGGGASGVVPYSMTVREIGPIVAASDVAFKLLGLLEASSAIADRIALISDLTVADATEAMALLAAIPVSILSLEPIANGFSSALRLLGPSGKVERQRTARNSEAAANIKLGSLFSDAETASGQLRDAINSIRSTAPSAYTSAKGHLRFETASAPAFEPSQLGWETCRSLNEIVDSMRFASVMGCFFSMSRSEYQASISGGGVSDGAATVRHTVEHTARVGDTGASISAEYGVNWSDILRLNRMTPDEALFPGAKLLVPLTRAIGNVGVAGLEVFDSHTGVSVYGKDIDISFRVENGDLAIVSGVDCLEQGLNMLVEKYGGELYKHSDSVPASVAADLVAERLMRVLRREPRVATVESVTSESNPATLHTVLTANVRAIGGQSVGVTA